MAVLVLAACSDQADGDTSDDPAVVDLTDAAPDVTEPTPEPESEPEPVAEPEPEPQDPFAIPEEITPEYLTAVLNELWRLETETDAKAQAKLTAGQLLTPDVLDELRAIHRETSFGFAAGDLQSSVDEDFRFAPPDHGQPRYEVEDILEVSERCIVLTGIFDITDSANTNFEGDPIRVDSYVVLNRADEERDPSGWNTTPWMFALVGENPEPDPEFYMEFCP